MSVYKINQQLPLSNRINTLNDMVIEVSGKTIQGQFNKNEIDQIFTDIGLDHQFRRDQVLGHTITNYTDWIHYQAEVGYSIWKITPTNYKHNAVNQLYMDGKAFDFRGEASAVDTTFNKVWDYLIDVYTDDTTIAGNGLSVFELLETTTDYQYLGSSSPFKGIDYTFNIKGNNYTLKYEYWNGTQWTQLTAVANNLEDDTSGWNTDGHVIWDLPSDWATCIVNSSLPLYYIRISTTTTPVTVAWATSIKPTTSIKSILSLTSSDIDDENWAWCSYAGSIYVTLRNSGNSAYEGDYFITSSSSSVNLQNYFIHNHEFTSDYEDSSYYGSGISVESGVSYGDLVYISDQYTFNAADADIWRKRCMGVLLYPGCVKTSSGLAKNVNTVGAANIVPGDVLYLSQTPGKVSRTAPAPGGGRIQQRVGIAISYESSGNVVDMIFNPEYV